MAMWEDAIANGELGQMVERPLSIREVSESMPEFSSSSAKVSSSCFSLEKYHLLDICEYTIL